MEILDCRVVLPAFVNVKHEEVVYNVFVYIDHMNKDVIIIDDDQLLCDKAELRKAIYAHIVAQRRHLFVPPTPSEGFTKLNPETYMNNEKS